ncbi:MAG: helix-turn-helix domain-containing protein [Actinomycetota bacterium]
MSGKHWDRLEEEIVMRDDEQLLADWREAQRRDETEGGPWNRLELWDAVRSAQYFTDRRDRDQLGGGASRQTMATSRQTMAAGLPAARDDREVAVHPVGRAVAAERARAGLRQAECAEGAGMTRDALAKVEAGQRRLTFVEACRLADFLRVPLDRFRPG